jgi:hypothetical protein
MSLRRNHEVHSYISIVPRLWCNIIVITKLKVLARWDAKDWVSLWKGGRESFPRSTRQRPTLAFLSEMLCGEGARAASLIMLYRERIMVGIITRKEWLRAEQNRRQKYILWFSRFSSRRSRIAWWINPAAKSDSLRWTQTYGKLFSSDTQRGTFFPPQTLQTRHFRINFHQSSRTLKRFWMLKDVAGVFSLLEN